MSGNIMGLGEDGDGVRVVIVYLGSQTLRACCAGQGCFYGTPRRHGSHQTRGQLERLCGLHRTSSYSLQQSKTMNTQYHSKAHSRGTE